VVNLSALLDNTDSQTLSFDPLLNELSISGGNAIPLPTPAGDDWGAQTAATQGPITGNGTAGSPIALANGSTTGDVLVWNGASWISGADQVNDADSDPLNEIQTLTYDPATGNLTISGTGGNTVTLPIPAGDNWGTQTAATTGAISGNGTAFSPINLAPGNAANQVWRWNGAAWVLAVDNDGDPTNEIQTLSFDPATQDLTLTGQLGNIDLSPLLDNWGTQSAATSGLIIGNGVAPNAIRLADGSAPGQVMKWTGATWVLATDSVNDADSDPNNEIQTLSIVGNNLSISNGNTVVLPTQPGDNWGTQTAIVDGPLTGSGIIGDSIRITNGTAAGDILEWNGAAWVIVPNPAGGGTLDDAYRFDIPNLSQQIVADQGPVIIRESNPPSSNAGLIVTSNSNTNNAFGNLSQGNILYFNSANGAFRAGRMFTAGLWNTGPTTVGNSSFAANQNTIASGARSSAFGDSATASGQNSFATGYQTIASGANAAAFGVATEASGAQSFATGFGSIASGGQSMAVNGATASGTNSFAAGSSSIASGVNSFAVGLSTLASGNNSFSAGSGNRSKLLNSITLGEGLVVTGQAGVALGHFNDTINFQNNQTGFGSQTWPVLMVGNGTGAGPTPRRNAMVVLRNGNVGIGTDQPAEKLEVNGNIRMPFNPIPDISGTLYLDGSPFLHANSSLTNTFLGISAGNHANTVGTQNTSLGYSSLSAIGLGSQNTAVGYGALNALATGQSNVGIGYFAGANKPNSLQLVAIGDYALEGAGLAQGAVGIGVNALRNSSGSNNTAVGYQAGYINAGSGVTGENNVFIGRLATTTITNLNNSIAIGNQASVNANGSVAIGNGSSTNFTNSVALGNGAIATAINMIRLGDGAVTLVESSGAFTTVSDRKFKTNIQNSALGLDFVMRLRPVTYNMVEGHEGILYTGLIAQELEQVVDDMGVEFSGLKRPANETDHYSVNYATLTIPLIKAVQEQQAEIEALRAENAELRRQVEYIMTVIEGRDE